MNEYQKHIEQRLWLLFWRGVLAGILLSIVGWFVATGVMSVMNETKACINQYQDINC